VLMGFIDHVEARGREGCRQLLRYGIAGLHGVRLGAQGFAVNAISLRAPPETSNSSLSRLAGVTPKSP
jgi:hypothetical protein